MIKLECFNSGNLVKDPKGYKYFLPTKINDEWTWQDQSINQLIEKASVKLGELNSFSKLVPNIDLFIQLHVAKEAVISSRIEGTRTQIDEAFLDIEDIEPERRNDWKEVNNYTKAFNYAIDSLEKIPISTRLIKSTHAILLEGARGEHKSPGDYRNSQNWIGGANLIDAVFIPPHQHFVNELMSDLEEFINDDSKQMSNLVKVAIAHYQFETIHPFLDGNGRIGRLLITLFLVDKKILSKPLLYLSVFFEKNKGLYYDNLTNVRTKNDLIRWIKYFLVGISEMAESSAETLSQVLELKSEIELLINTKFGRRSQKAIIFLNELFCKPVMDIEDLVKILDSSYNTANSLIADFVKYGILQEMTGNKRNRIYIFEKYLNLFST